MRELLGGSAPEVAPLLLGWTLTHVTDAGTVAVELTEVEAYEGASDPASHAYRGRTARNEVMFGPAGNLYVYLSHGLHWCLNVVTGPEGSASAVLLRAGRIVEGVDLARQRRGERVDTRSLARGPGNLARALGIAGQDNGRDLLSDPDLYLSPGPSTANVASGPRVGISLAAEVPWRWWVEGDTTVSVYRRSPRQ